MIPVLVTAPVTSIITTDEAKDQATVTHSHQDAMFADLVAAVTAHIDGYKGILNRAIMPQTWAQDFTCWGDLRLSMPDVTAIRVTAFDADDVAVTPDSSELKLDVGGPYVVATGPAAARVRVEYDCALPAEQLPAVKALTKMLVAAWYDERHGTEQSPAVTSMIEALRWRTA